MGDPKKPRKKYKTPRHPWRSDQLSQELYLVGTYGLRNKRELWKAQTELSRIRKNARAILAGSPEVRTKREGEFLASLTRIGVIGPEPTLDDVLTLTVEDLLERRLQTVVWRMGLTKTPYQARQMIAHGHIAVGNRSVMVPGYMVRRDEGVRIREDSPFYEQALAVSV